MWASSGTILASFAHLLRVSVKNFDKMRYLSRPSTIGPYFACSLCFHRPRSGNQHARLGLSLNGNFSQQYIQPYHLSHSGNLTGRIQPMDGQSPSEYMVAPEIDFLPLVAISAKGWAPIGGRAGVEAPSSCIRRPDRRPSPGLIVRAYRDVRLPVRRGQNQARSPKTKRASETSSPAARAKSAVRPRRRSRLTPT